MATFLPWQVPDAQRLLSDQAHLPHALLINGMAGTGKRQFALALAATLLCEDKQQGLACGKCQGCTWVAAGTHPDLKLVRPEAVAVREGAAMAEEDASSGLAESGSTAKRKPSEELRIEQIRALEPWYHQATHRGGWRVVVLYPAEALSVVSANALLKALEEPPANTLFLLASDAPDRLLPTLVSRCQKFALALPDKAHCIDWLKQQAVDDPENWLAAAGGAPLAALDLAQSGQPACPSWARELVSGLGKGALVDLPGLADNLAKGPASAWLKVLQRLCVDVSLVAAKLPARYFPGLSAAYADAVETAELEKLTELTAWVDQQARLANHPLSPKLFAQQCLQRFCDVLR
jgi:DNA polymerase-3 subunit delta'